MAPSTRTPQPAKALLILRGVTVRELAGELGCSAQHLGRLLLGHERPSAAMRAKLADYFGEDESVLFVDDDRAATQHVKAFIRRTTSSSGVPERLEDAGAAEQVAGLLRGAP
jgi:transcriptional regulator with XRE-family HTH domain